MNFKKPVFWDLKKPNLFSNILFPFSFLVRLNNFLREMKLKKKSDKRIIKEFSEANIVVNDLTNQILKKTICVGVSSFPADSEDIDQVLKNADNFLYEAKNKGRSQVAVYNKEDDNSIDLF